MLLFLLGCNRLEPGVHLVTTPALAPLLDDAVQYLDDPRVSLLIEEDPLDELGRLPDEDPLDIAVLADGSCADCYQITQNEDGFVVKGGTPLGIQYGVADVLERHGYRFFHPWQTLRPDTVSLLDEAGLTEALAPEQEIRGLHPHTIHPTEALWDLWIPGEANLEGSRRMIDWLVKNRGNHLQWPGLDNITGADHAAWKSHTAAILSYAHNRGVRVGLGVQLFGGANLQHAYDLLEVPAAAAEQEAQIDQQLGLVLDGLPFDVLNVSFGEFSGETPEAFISSLDQVIARAHHHDPGLEVSAVVHVGEMEDTRVEYQGEEMIYYFLVKYADPSLVPYVHTVMYYNLFEDAGLAYGHEDFSDHRDYLQERLRADEPVVYFPESAYWVAFDTPVPVYLPLYVQSRWFDMDQLRQAGTPLTQHILFSSGWEWGYWQNDVATLRSGYTLPADWREHFTWMYAPYGDSRIADALIEVSEAQHTSLIGERLAPWLAGRDAIMDLGRNLNIVAQPDRPSFEEIVAMSAEDRAALRAEVLEPLRAHAAVYAEVLPGLPTGDRWQDEVVDGVEIDSLRTRYIADTLDALLLFADGDPEAVAVLDRAAETLSAAQTVVARRHANLHDPDPTTLISPVDNPTIYDYGYLHQADVLCFWHRERIFADRILRGSDEADPGCAL